MFEESGTAEDYEAVLKVLIMLIKSKRDLSSSLPYLRGLVEQAVNKGAELTDKEKAILAAMYESGQREILVNAVMSARMPMDIREEYLKKLTGSVLDSGLAEVYKDNDKRRFFALLTKVHETFGIKPPAVMMKNLIESKTTIEQIQELRPRVEGKTLPELMSLFEGEGKEDKLLLTYFIFNQPQSFGSAQDVPLQYSFGITFELFKNVIEQALGYRKAAATNNEAKAKLRE
jgi:hypothetical protein